jgi:hypothetical protein
LPGAVRDGSLVFATFTAAVFAPVAAVRERATEIALRLNLIDRRES